MARSWWALALLVAAYAPCAQLRAADTAAAYPFSMEVLLAEAKRGAATLFAPQRNTVPAALGKLSPEQYRSIRFNPEMGIWRAEELPFRLELLPVGFNFQTNVTVSTVDAGMARDLVATPAMFDMAPSVPAKLGLVSLPLSGFRVLSHINSNKVWDEFLVFQGASYFRAVAQHLLYGLSARGLPARSFRRSPTSGSNSPRRGPRNSSSMRCWRASPPPARFASPCSRASRPPWTSTPPCFRAWN